jgi:hypothetical protein
VIDMPYVSAVKTTTITVQAVTITLNNITKPDGTAITWAKQGDPVQFRGTIKIDTTGWGGVPVDIYMGDSATSTPTKIASGTSASGGGFVIDWTVAYTLGCTTKYFRAYHPGTGTWSNALSLKIAFNTDITVATNKAIYAPGESMTISGSLRYARSSATDWVGLGGKTVTLRILSGTTEVWRGTVTTGTDGSYSATTTAPTAAGSYTVEASYAGEGLAVAGAVAVAPIGIPLAPSDIIPIAVAIGVPIALAVAENRRLIRI